MNDGLDTQINNWSNILTNFKTHHAEFNETCLQLGF